MNGNKKIVGSGDSGVEPDDHCHCGPADRAERELLYGSGQSHDDSQLGLLSTVRTVRSAYQREIEA
jgi:hypothetical protein